MHEYVLTLLAAAAVTYLLTPLVRRFAIAVGALHAARDRDVHVVPTPLLGGFAMYGGLAAGLLVASQLPGLNSAFAETNMSKGLLLAGGLVALMGFVDDRWGMGALSKLAGQIAAGVILVWSGAEVTWLPSPYGGTLGLTSDQQVAATILVVVVTINAVNFIDGLDGLAAGIAGIGAAAFFVYYFTLTNRLGLSDQTGPALASAVLVGVCLGFLPHNFYPARIFMGDTGSMLIGLLLAYAPISSLSSLDPGSLAASHPVNRFGAILPLLLPAAVLLIPYADLLMAVVRRVRAGMSVFAPDKKHLQHRLLAIGHSHRTSVLIMYLWAALFAGGVVWLSIVRTPLFVLAGVTVAAMLALILVSMPRLRPWNRTATANGAAIRSAAKPAGARAARAKPAGAKAAAAKAAAAKPPAAGRTRGRPAAPPAPSTPPLSPSRPTADMLPPAPSTRDAHSTPPPAPVPWDVPGPPTSSPPWDAPGRPAAPGGWGPPGAPAASGASDPVGLPGAHGPRGSRAAWERLTRPASGSTRPDPPSPDPASPVPPHQEAPAGPGTPWPVPLLRGPDKPSTPPPPA
jgi:UDP-GlcNAc:undecaprenyl-phosphate GlcNAc-1-phosphate transferase